MYKIGIKQSESDLFYNQERERVKVLVFKGRGNGSCLRIPVWVCVQSAEYLTISQHRRPANHFL